MPRVDTQAVTWFFALLAVLCQAFVVASVLIRLFSPRALWPLWRAQVAHVALPAAAAVATMATLGSLYLSEIANFTPCRLCWFQRIGLYPLAVVLLIAAWRQWRTRQLFAQEIDDDAAEDAADMTAEADLTYDAQPLPVWVIATFVLCALGGAISIWHVTIEWFPSLSSSSSCDPDNPCTIIWFRHFWNTIPAMALTASATIATLLAILAAAARHGEADLPA